MSTGSVSSCGRIASKAVEKPVEEARHHVQSRGLKHADETSWRHGPQRLKSWLWVACTPLVTVFLLHQSRSAKAARQLLGKVLGVLVTDRYKGYEWWPLEARQLCWAHIKRDIRAMIDADGLAHRVGEGLEKQRKKLFELWYRVRDGTLTFSDFQGYVKKIRQEVHVLLLTGSSCGHKKTQSVCNDLLRLEAGLWTFTRIQGVEPTNNSGERAIRPAVIWRKLCFGTHSERGARFIERMMTVSCSLRTQNRSVLTFVSQALTAYITKSAAPSLVPQQARQP